MWGAARLVSARSPGQADPNAEDDKDRCLTRKAVRKQNHHDHRSIVGRARQPCSKHAIASLDLRQLRHRTALCLCHKGLKASCAFFGRVALT